MDHVKRIWYLSPMRAAMVQASLRICAVSPEPLLLAHTSSESRGTFRQKARSLAPLNGWACAVKICHDGMLKDTNSLDATHISIRGHINITYLKWQTNTFFVAIVQEKDKCKLFCKADSSPSHFYMLNHKVIDGTKCRPDDDDICVEGQCRVSVYSFLRDLEVV